MESVIAARVSLLKFSILNVLGMGFWGSFLVAVFCWFFFSQTKDNRFLCSCPSPDAYTGMI